MWHANARARAIANHRLTTFSGAQGKQFLGAWGDIGGRLASKGINLPQQAATRPRRKPAVPLLQFMSVPVLPQRARFTLSKTSSPRMIRSFVVLQILRTRSSWKPTLTTR
jgi:hypothetical protein